jgi:GTP-binding protein
MDDELVNLEPLFDTILEKVPPAANDTTKPFRMQAFNLAYDNFLGRMAVGRVYEGIVKNGQNVTLKNLTEKLETEKLQNSLHLKELRKKK